MAVDLNLVLPESSALIHHPVGYGTTSTDDEEKGDNSSNNNTHGDGALSHHGAKSIGMLGSFAIAVNSLAGPAILQLPATYQMAGLIPTTLCLIAVGVLSAFCSLHMANVVSKVPGNANFDQTIEFSEPFRIFWGRRAFLVTQVMFFFCTVCLNVAAIVDTAQVVDTFLGHSPFGSFGLTPHSIERWEHGPCTRKEVKLHQCDPFDDAGDYILTTGYVIAALVFLPISLMDLKENAAWQIFGFMVLLVTSLEFIVSFSLYGLEWRHVPMWGGQWDRMLGVILFNFSLVVAIPAWLHEKKESVSVPKVIYGSSALSTILYIFVGAFGAYAIPQVNPNVLEPMVSGAFGDLMRIGASIFAFFIIGLDIPLFSVLTRYNLVNSGLCSPCLANLLVVYIPWGLSWMFYQGNDIATLLSWGGVLFTSFVAFILPLALALYTLYQHSTISTDGSIRVYGKYLTNKKAMQWSVWVLLVLASIAVAVAIWGLSGPPPPVKFTNPLTGEAMDTPPPLTAAAH